jgi:zinc protease
MRKSLFPLVTLLLTLWSCGSSKKDQAKQAPPPEVQKAEKLPVLEPSVVLSGEQSDKGINLNARKYRLDNGLTVILVKKSTIPVFSMHLFYRVGSKHEYAGITGASHFLEHMTFKGATKFGLGSFDKIVENNGGNSNAYTNYDMTVYHQSLPIEALDLMIEVESDRMQNLLLEEAAFVREKYVVLEERKGRYENSPRGQLSISMMNEMFKGTPYGTPIIGSIEDIKSVTREQVQKYFKQFYVPNNTILVISGDIDFDRTIGLVAKNFGPIPKSEKVNLIKRERERSDLYKSTPLARNEIHLKGKSKNVLFRVAFPGWPFGSRNAYVGDLLSSVLSGGNSSYLRQQFVKSKKPVALSMYSYNYNLQNGGVFLIGGELSNKISKKNFHKRLKREIKSFCKNKITQRDLEKVKNQYLLSLYNSLATNNGIADYLGSMEFYLNDFTAFSKDLEIYEGIQLKEVVDLCHKVFDFNKSLYLTVWEKNKEKMTF